MGWHAHDVARRWHGLSHPPKWPGTRAAFEATIDDLKGKLSHDDLLLIHTNQCGGWDGVPGTACLYTYPNADRYYANHFAAKVGELPRFSQLIVMMGQCNSGGFTTPIIAQSPADATSVACAATEPNSAFASPDGNWDTFARDWIAAQAGHDPFGAALAFNPDADGDGRVEAEEAFGYANAVKRLGETPNFNESSEAGGDISLGQEYKIWRWWRHILYESLQQHRVKRLPHEYLGRLHKLEPELTALTASLDKTSTQMREELKAKVGVIVTAAFK